MSTPLQSSAVHLSTAQLIKTLKSDDGSTYFEFLERELNVRIARMSAEELFALPAHVKPVGRHRGERAPLIVMPSIGLRRRQLATA